MDYNERDRILFGEDYDKEKYLGGVRRFEGCDLENLRTLVKKGFLDLKQKQNDSPNTQEFMWFMSDHPKWVTAHGYAVSPERDDVCITIEGLDAVTGGMDRDEYTELLIDFVTFCRYADELNIQDGALWSWWD